MFESLATEASRQSSCGSWEGGEHIDIYIYIYTYMYIYMYAHFSSLAAQFFHLLLCIHMSIYLCACMYILMSINPDIQPSYCLHDTTHLGASAVEAVPCWDFLLGPQLPPYRRLRVDVCMSDERWLLQNARRASRKWW